MAAPARGGLAESRSLSRSDSRSMTALSTLLVLLAVAVFVVIAVLGPTAVWQKICNLVWDSPVYHWRALSSAWLFGVASAFWMFSSAVQPLWLLRHLAVNSETALVAVFVALWVAYFIIIEVVCVIHDVYDPLNWTQAVPGVLSVCHFASRAFAAMSLDAPTASAANFIRHSKGESLPSQFLAPLTAYCGIWGILSLLSFLQLTAHQRRAATVRFQVSERPLDASYSRILSTPASARSVGSNSTSAPTPTDEFSPSIGASFKDRFAWAGISPVPSADARVSSVGSSRRVQRSSASRSRPSATGATRTSFSGASHTESFHTHHS